MKNKALIISKNFLIIILLSIPIFLISLNAELIIGDEIWNFQNIAKLVNGGKMYVDCNIIITPFFYIIGYCFVKFLTGSIFGFRVYNVFIFLTLLLSTFALFRALKIDKLKSGIYTLIVFLFIMPYISVGANYNVLAESIFIFGIVLFLNRDKVRYYELYLGLIAFACIFSKQNIGGYFFIALIIAEIFLNKKEAIPHLIKESMIMLACTIIAVLIMHLTGCFNGFLNYTIYGMGEFASENFSIQEKVEIIILGYILIAIFSYILGFLLSKQSEDISKNISVLSIFSLFLNFSIIPIANLYHTSLAILVNLIIFIYLFEMLLFNKINNKIILEIITLVLYVFVSSYGIICLHRASKNIKITDKENVYFSSNMSIELNEQLEEVVDYIKEKENEGIDVICITADSPLYMTYLHKNHGELDLCFQGNLGENGMKKILEKVKNLDNTIVLINRDSYWQEVQELKDYIIEHNNKNLEVIHNLYAFRLD